MTETEKQELEPRKPENVYDDWQIERIRICKGAAHIRITSDLVIAEYDYDQPWPIFKHDGTREGFQAAFKEWSHANEEIEPPF